MENQLSSERRQSVGNALIYFCVIGMVISSTVKFLQPAKAVAYMGSMGFQGGIFFLIAGLELLSAAVFCLRSTRSLGLLLVSAYFGGAISAHLAHHPYVTGGPFLTYMLNHPLVGALEPGVFLAAAWIGVGLRHPEVWWSLNEPTGGRELPRQRHQELAMGSR